MANQLSDVIFTTIGTEQCKEMSELINSGKVQIEKIDAPLDDMMAYGLEFFAKLRKSIKSSYALFDESSNELMSKMVGTNIIHLSDIEKRKVTHAGFADNVLQHLPSFDSATTNEIIDIRKELEEHIVPFRKVMLEYSEQVQSMPWENDFESECQLLFDKCVAPTIYELEQAVRDNNIIKNLTIDVLKDPKNLVSAGGLAIGMATNGALPTIVDAFSEVYPGLAATASVGQLPLLLTTTILTTPRLISKIVESLQTHSQSNREIEKNECYFYYKAKMKMAKL